MNSLDKYNELEAEERMKIIAQNGNNGEHYEDKGMVNKYGKKEILVEYYANGNASYDFSVDDDGYCFEYTYDENSKQLTYRNSEGYSKGFEKSKQETINQTNEQRKETPIFSGVLSYFPDALKEVAKCSFIGQMQHNKDKPLAWDRSKSGNEYDSLTRHLIDSSKEDFDTDGTLHKAKIAWRALAGLQKHLEENKQNTLLNI